MVLSGSTTLPKPLKLLHFFTLNTAVSFALNLWHSRGQRFDPAYLHQSNIIRTCSPSGTGSGLLFIWTIFLYNKNGPCHFWQGPLLVQQSCQQSCQHSNSASFQQSIQYSFHALLSNVQTPCVPLDYRRTPGALGAGFFTVSNKLANWIASTEDDRNARDTTSFHPGAKPGPRRRPTTSSAATGRSVVP